MEKIVHVQTVMLEKDLIRLKSKTGKPYTKDALFDAIAYYLEMK